MSDSTQAEGQATKLPTVVDVWTPYGDRYRVNCLSGRLVLHRKHGPATVGSEDWTIQGIARIGPWGSLKFEGLAGLTGLAALAGRRTTYKNGKPRYTLTDRDHGTFRVHGNPEVHGIARVERVGG